MSRRMKNNIKAILSKYQFKFKKNVITREAILALRTIIEKRIRNDKPNDVARRFRGSPPPLLLA